MSTARIESRGLSALFLAALLAGPVLAQRPPRRQRPQEGPPAPPSSAPAQAPAPAKKEPEGRALAIVDATIHTGAGAVLRRSTLLIKGGKVAELGPGVEPPADAEIVNAAGRHLCPGIVALNLSGVGVGAARESYRDALNPFDPRLKMALAAGITAAMEGRNANLDGKNCVLKYAYGDLDRMLVAENTTVGLGARELLGPGRKQIDKGLELFQAWRSGWFEHRQRLLAGDKSSKEPAVPKEAAGLVRAFKGEAVLWIEAPQGLAELRASLDFLRVVDLPAVLNGTVEGWIMASELGKARCMAVVWPRRNVPRDEERMSLDGSSAEAAALLSRAGVAVACYPSPSGGLGAGGIGMGGLLGWDMNTPFVDPAYAVRGGLSPEEALSSVTLVPARMAGVGHRMGSLEPGKDADFLVMTGDPLHYQSLVDLAYIEGKLFYDRALEPQLKDVPVRPPGPK